MRDTLDKNENCWKMGFTVLKLLDLDVGTK